MCCQMHRHTQGNSDTTVATAQTCIHTPNTYTIQRKEDISLIQAMNKVFVLGYSGRNIKGMLKMEVLSLLLIPNRKYFQQPQF